MKHMSILGLCLAGILVMASLVSTGAQAKKGCAGPEWKPARGTFRKKGAIKKFKLERCIAGETIHEIRVEPAGSFVRKKVECPPGNESTPNTEFEPPCEVEVELAVEPGKGEKGAVSGELQAILAAPVAGTVTAPLVGKR